MQCMRLRRNTSIPVFDFKTYDYIGPNDVIKSFQICETPQVS